jgi:hypothetical protein
VICYRGFSLIISSVSTLLTIIELFAVRLTRELVAVGLTVRLTVSSVIELTTFSLFLDPFSYPLLYS